MNRQLYKLMVVGEIKDCLFNLIDLFSRPV